jgi:hypothetical protein
MTIEQALAAGTKGNASSTMNQSRQAATERLLAGFAFKDLQPGFGEESRR